MATRKSELISSGVQPTDVYRTSDLEKRILTATLKKNENVKNSPLTRLSGAKTQITYFHQVPTDSNDFLVNTSGFNSGDPNNVNYIMIKNFYVKMDVIDSSWDETEANGPKTTTFEGKIVLLPNTILPLANDYFTMEYRERTCLFRITEAKPVTVDQDTAYELQFTLQFDYYTYENSELAKSVVGDYVFETSRIGTKDRTIFRSSEYEYINNLRDLYYNMRDIYIRDFWDEHLSTYRLIYKEKLSSDDDDIVYKYLVATEKGLKQVPNNTSNSSSIIKKYLNKEMYDSELIDFLKNNRIFDSMDEKYYIPEQYTAHNRINLYTDTVFYAVEKRDRKLFRRKAFMPIEFNIATTTSQPLMFGKINLVHTSAINETSLDLYPNNLFEMIHNTLNDNVSPMDITGNIYDKMSYIVALYINKFDKNILTSLLDIAKKSDELRLYENTIPRHECFYLFPLLGYVIKETINILYSKETVNKFADPKDYIPK